MQCYTELTPPTAVTHAVYLPFLNSKANNLVVAKGSLLQIFEVKSREDQSTAQNGDRPLQQQAAGRAKERTSLVLIAEYHLSGVITSAARIHILDSRSGGEALLLAFKDAKLSLIEWDPETHSVSTISIHYYEGEELDDCPWMPDLSETSNFLSADPNSRCAALKFGQRKLAILPFRQNEDDLMDDGYGSDEDEPMDEPAATKSSTADANASSGPTQTPYKSSFVLPLTAVDPALTHPVHLAFLHEYRTPTFGIIVSSKASSSALLAERKDILNYIVFTLDLEQRASTKLVSVSGLPYDLSRVIPLPLPVGGALLLGHNELIHVDQSGKTHAVAVNDFARQASSFPMADQSELCIRLEECVIEHISSSTGDLLMVLKTGELVTLRFRLDGRSVSGLEVKRVAPERGGTLLHNTASCLTEVGNGCVFVGSEDGDSVLLGWSRASGLAQKPRKKSHAELLEADPDLSLDEDDFNDEDEDEDDLYDESGPSKAQSGGVAIEVGGLVDAKFDIYDVLLGLGPLHDVTVSEVDHGISSDPSSMLELVGTIGRGRGAALGILSREIPSNIVSEHSLPSTQSAWPLKIRKQHSASTLPSVLPSSEYDDLLITLEADNQDAGSTKVHRITKEGIEEMLEGEIERDGAVTIDVGTLHNQTRLVQVLKGEIRSYDSELSLIQIWEDEESGAELQIVNSSFADPYLMIVRDDSSIVVLGVDSNGELEELERSETFQTTKWLSGCLYKQRKPLDDCLAFLITAEGALQIFRLPDLTKPVFVAEGLGFLPTILTQEYIPRRTANKTALVEILVADLGDAQHCSPYLILRSSIDDMFIYQPYKFPANDEPLSLASDVRWRKIPQPQLPTYTDDVLETSQRLANNKALRALQNVGGHCTVFQNGPSSRFVMRDAAGLPKVLRLRGEPVMSISSIHIASCERGFATVGSKGNVTCRQLLPETSFSAIGWAVRKVTFSQSIDKVRYCAPKQVYVVATSEQEDFTLPDDSYHQNYAREDIKFRPHTERGYVKLLHPKNWTIVDIFELEPNETTMCMEVLSLEVSEITHERKQLITVGTAIIQGEDLATKGCIYVFEVIHVVPEPGRPETNCKLKLIVKEEVKGAVTAVSNIGSQGFMLVAQGQKCMVRGLKEDNTLLPVAFMDMQCYVTVLNCLQNSGLVLMGDAARGVWMTGYTEEPYKMIRLGQSRTQLDVLSAELLPHDGNLHIIIADADCNLHVLQYDPEHPKSLAGARLLHKSTFHTAHFATTMKLLPSTIHPANPDAADDSDAMAVEDDTKSKPLLQQILVTSQNGALAILTPVTEPQYRRLGALQTFLTNVLEHACGLNPRGHRAIESEGYGSRGVLDGDVLMRWNELSSQRKAEGLGKVGVKEWVVRADLEFIGGGGLGYL